MAFGSTMMTSGCFLSGAVRKVLLYHSWRLILWRMASNGPRSAARGRKVNLDQLHPFVQRLPTELLLKEAVDLLLERSAYPTRKGILCSARGSSPIAMEGVIHSTLASFAGCSGTPQKRQEVWEGLTATGIAPRPQLPQDVAATPSRSSSS